MHHSLLRQLSLGVMMMEQSYAEAYFPFVASLLLNSQFDASVFGVVQKAPEFFYASNSANSNGVGKAKEKRVAVIYFNGPIIKYDEACGPVGTETLADYIDHCASNPDISALVLRFDTGGGMGSACQRPVEAIYNCSKPVLAYVGNGTTASGGYYIASACDEIYATHAKTDMIGSIGTYVTLADYAKHYKEKHGLELHEIYATKSTEKNALFKEALKGNYEPIIKEYIDPFNEAFLDQVKMARPGVSEDALKGKLFYAEQAKQMGLIDGFKTFKEVIQRAADLTQ